MEINNLSYSYNSSKKVLKNINMKIQEGKITGILGTSGSSKTTLLKLISGILDIQEGNIKIDDITIDKGNKIENYTNSKINICLIPQNSREKFSNLKIKDELKFIIKYKNLKNIELDKKCSDALKMVGLNDSYLDKKIEELNESEIRKVSIAAGLILNPKILILDDPTIGLDNLSKKNLIILLRKLITRFNKTIIIASNDVEFLHKIVNYLYVLDKGKIVLDGDKYEVFTNDKLLEYGIEPPNVIKFEKLVKEKKNIKLGYRDEINDLIKDIYRNR